ncbi:MAG: hypothetical protein HFH84_15055 [Lachnospiraceae bacterium]|jgi:hypothetical protein|nr:hypothetical protein [Lachnospiraceae bacterium]
MGNIRDYLNEILSAVYGKDVRQAIHDGIFQCYEDGKALSEMQLATEEDIDRILDGTYSDLPDDKEEGITDEEIREIVDTAFSRGE